MQNTMNIADKSTATTMIAHSSVSQHAFEAMLKSHLSLIYKAAVRYTKNKAQAEDLVNDTVVRALRFRDKFQAGSNFKGWIHTVLTNTFIHGYRRQKREREILQEITRQDLNRQIRGGAYAMRLQPEQILSVEHQMSDDVKSALASLPEDFRSVVILCDVNGLSYRDIATLLCCPQGTVMSRLHRGRRLLEAKLEQVALSEGIIRGRSTGRLERVVAVSRRNLASRGKKAV